MTVFESQVDACKEFFQKQLPWLNLQPVLYNKRWVFDITGFDGQQVISVLFAIVNDRDQFKMNKTFYLLIRDIFEGTTEAGFEELFRFTARPTPHQPGNAIVILRPRGRKKFKRDGAKKYDELNGALKAFYPDMYDVNGTLILKGTTIFAIHIKQLFKNNALTYNMSQTTFNVYMDYMIKQLLKNNALTYNIPKVTFKAYIDYMIKQLFNYLKNIPQATFEVYMMLLFEIARRLVTLDNPTAVKTAYDVLPIGSAIARVLTLLECGACHFEDVFLPGGRFHCFSGKPEQRRRAIDNINTAIFDITKYETFTKDQHLKELQEVFCFVKPLVMPSSPVEELARQLKNLMKSDTNSWSDEEYTTAFEHLTVINKIVSLPPI